MMTPPNLTLAAFDVADLDVADFNVADFGVAKFKETVHLHGPLDRDSRQCMGDPQKWPPHECVADRVKGCTSCMCRELLGV